MLTNYSNEIKKKMLDVFKSVINNIGGKEISDNQLWRFMKVFCPISIDIDTNNSMMGYLVKALLKPEEADIIWLKALDYIQYANQNAGTITEEHVPVDIIDMINKNADSKKNILYNVSQENKLFIGRKKILKELQNALDRPNVIILKGIAGIGKTQIVKKFIYSNQYKYVYWIHTNNKLTLDKEYEYLLSYVGVMFTPGEDEVNREKVKNYIENIDDCLLIYDNADDIEIDELTTYMPRNCKIIITTTNNIWDEDRYLCIRVKDFEYKEAEEFLEYGTSKRQKTTTDNMDVKNLGNILKYYPLALEHARAYINCRKISFKEYIELFRECSYEVMQNKVNEYQLTVLKTFRIAFDKISSKSFELLSNCAVLNNNKIPINEIFFINKLFNRISMDKLVEELEQYSLIEEENNFFNMHGVAQEITRLELKNRNTYLEYLKKMAEVVSNITNNDTIKTEDQKKKSEIILPHMIALVEQIALKDVDVEAYSYLCFQIGQIQYSFGNPKIAIEYYEKCIQYLHNIKNQTKIAAVLGNIGIAYYYSGYDSTALEILQHAEDIAIKINDQKILSNVLGNISIIYKFMKEPDKSLDYAKKALKLAYETKDYNRIGSQILNIGNIYKLEFKYDKALQEYKKVLKISRENNDNSLEIKALGSIGIMYIYKYDSNSNEDELNTAIEKFQLSLEISQKLNDKRSEAINLDYLGSCYVRKKRYEIALDKYNNALNISNDFELKQYKTNSLLNRGICYLHMNKKNEAEADFNEALTLAKSINHTSVIKQCEEYINKVKQE
jgi:tetratricopeptide (TPR) repeat protein